VNPNPFNPRTEIRFDLHEAAPARLCVYDLTGCRLAVLHAGVLPAGEHTVTWQARDDRGRALGSGVYLLRLSAGGESSVTKLVLLE